MTGRTWRQVDTVGAMPYPKKLLNSYETLALDLHPHWWYFAETARALVGAIALGVVSLVVLRRGQQRAQARRLDRASPPSSSRALWLLGRYLSG